MMLTGKCFKGGDDMRYLLACLLLSSCGGTYKVQGDVNVHHEVTVDVPALTAYFDSMCRQPASNDTCINVVVQTCIDCMVGRFYNKL